MAAALNCGNILLAVQVGHWIADCEMQLEEMYEIGEITSSIAGACLTRIMIISCRNVLHTAKRDLTRLRV